MKCEFCGFSSIVPATGWQKAEILIIGDQPGKEELKQKTPFVGPTGNILRAELGKVGIDINQCRLTNLWQHPKNKNKDCLEYFMGDAIKESSGRKYILLLGSETSKAFLDHSVMSVAGLKMTSPYFSSEVVVPCPNPAIVFKKNGTIGELRLAIQKFAKYLENDGHS